MSLMDKIRAANDRPKEHVEVPEWGVDFYLLSMSGKDRDLYENRMLRARTGNGGSIEGMRASLIVACAVDESGNRVFTDADIPDLQAKSGVVLDRLATVAMRVSGLITEEQAEELEKN